MQRLTSMFNHQGVCLASTVSAAGGQRWCRSQPCKPARRWNNRTSRRAAICKQPWQHPCRSTGGCMGWARRRVDMSSCFLVPFGARLFDGQPGRIVSSLKRVVLAAARCRALSDGLQRPGSVSVGRCIGFWPWPKTSVRATSSMLWAKSHRGSHQAKQAAEHPSFH